MNKYKVIGVMSGTSMDGLDLAHCELIENENGSWDYKINQAVTIPYDEKWRLRLSKLRLQPSIIYHKTDRYFGQFIGQMVKQFIENHNLEVDLISSHGHTIFHQPESNITAQIGAGYAINAETGISVVSNFRSLDVVYGGEGAPISAIGDDILFPEFEFCLNLGGFANISTNKEGKRIAFDICPNNIILNRVAREFDMDYDEDGQIAEKGKIDYELLGALNRIDFYSQDYPKSLGREWINDSFWAHVRQSESDKVDKMKTLVDHIAEQIGNTIEDLREHDKPCRVYTTGGGAYNKTLIEHLKTHTDAEIVVPDNKIVEYKESLVFALMGVLRVLNKPNVLGHSTGSNIDSISGELNGDFSQFYK